MRLKYTLRHDSQSGKIYIPYRPYSDHVSRFTPRHIVGSYLPHKSAIRLEKYLPSNILTYS